MKTVKKRANLPEYIAGAYVGKYTVDQVAHYTGYSASHIFLLKSNLKLSWKTPCLLLIASSPKIRCC